MGHNVHCAYASTWLPVLVSSHSNNVNITSSQSFHPENTHNSLPCLELLLYFQLIHIPPLSGRVPVITHSRCPRHCWSPFHLLRVDTC